MFEFKFSSFKKDLGSEYFTKINGYPSNYQILATLGSAKNKKTYVLVQDKLNEG